MSPTPDISDLLDAASLNSPLTKVVTFLNCLIIVKEKNTGDMIYM